MKGLYNRNFGKNTGFSRDVLRNALDHIEPGQVYSFETRSLSGFPAPKTNRFAAIKILGITEWYVVVAVLDAIWDAPPLLHDIQGKSIIKEHRFACSGSPAVFGVHRDWWTPESDLDSFSYVAMDPVLTFEQSYVDSIASYAPTSRHAALEAVNYAAEGEWRWANDREDFTLEYKMKNTKFEMQHSRKMANWQKYMLDRNK